MHFSTLEDDTLAGMARPSIHPAKPTPSGDENASDGGTVGDDDELRASTDAVSLGVTFQLVRPLFPCP